MGLAVAYFGTYEPAYPRNAVLLAGLREAGVELHEFSVPLAHELAAADMATLRCAGMVAGDLARAHLRLFLDRQRDLRIDALVVGYPGHFLVPFAKLLARRRRAKLVFDPLVSLFDTFSGDRGLVGLHSPVGRALWVLDEATFRLPDLVVADTESQARYYRKAFAVPAARLGVVPVGALPVPQATGSARRLRGDQPLVVFQYGKWSPLHGADTVLDAAERLAAEPFQFVLAGEGQLSAELRERSAARGLANVTWLGMVSHDELRSRMLAADVCLGIFGGSAKAARVVPNKVYDALACGRPLVTLDAEASRAALAEGEAAVLVPAGDGAALAEALRRLHGSALRARLGAAALALYRRRFTPAAVADRLLAALEEVA
jgi:glycosyltransferase involved in cell wall biosynthesis